MAGSVLIFFALALLAVPAAVAATGWQAPVAIGLNSSPSAAVAPSPGRADVIGFGGDLVSKGTGPGWSAPTQVASGGTVTKSRIAADGAGDLTALWLSETGTRQFAIRSASKPVGGTWGPAVTLWEWDATSVEEPHVEGLRIVADAAGDLAAAWRQVYASAPEVFYEASTWAATMPAGGGWTAAQQFSAGTELEVEPVPFGIVRPPIAAPSVAIDPAGVATVLWRSSEESEPAEGTSEILAASSSAGGSWSEPEGVSEAGPPARATQPSIAVDDAGEAFAIWCSKCEVRGHPVDQAIQFAVKPPGGSWSVPIDISAPGRKAERPSIAVDARGNAAAVWVYEDTHRVQTGARPAGGAWTPPRPLSEAEKYTGEIAPALALRGASAIVAWHTRRGSRIRAAIRPPGMGWRAPVTIGTGTSNPVVAVATGGNAVASWMGKTSAEAAQYLAGP